MLLLKPGVCITGIRSEILLAVVAAEGAYQEIGHDYMVTACIDGKHTANSVHYAGQAVDLRTRDVPDGDLQKIVARRVLRGACYLPAQASRRPFRCRPMKVLGLTIASADRRSAQTPQNHAHKSRSKAVSFGLFTDRYKTPS